MSQVIQLFPHRFTTEQSETEIPDSTESSLAWNNRRETARAIRYCLESLLYDADAFDLKITRAALVVAIAATLNELD